MPASPTEVIAHPVLGDAAQRMIQRLNAYPAPALEGFEAHADADAVPQRGQPGVVDLQDNARLDDSLVLLTQGFRQSEDEVFFLRIILVGAIDFQAGGSRAGQEQVASGTRGCLELIDLALQ